MRHRIHGKQLSRDHEHRRAMLRNLAAGLFEHGQIETTMPKARAVQPFVERIITIAKRGTFRARRQIEAKLNDRRIHGWVADDNVPDARKDNPYFELPDGSDYYRHTIRNFTDYVSQGPSRWRRSVPGIEELTITSTADGAEQLAPHHRRHAADAGTGPAHSSGGYPSSPTGSVSACSAGASSPA